MRVISRRRALFIIAALGLSATGYAQSPRLFRIGYLRRETTGHPGIEYLEALRLALWQNESVKSELESGGYTGIGLYACDGPADMVRRLNLKEFDLAFTPANIYARQDAGYTAVLKSRRDADSFSPSRVYRRGIVFVSARSPLFSADEVTVAEMQRVLAEQRLAVVSTQSIAGYQAPLLRLATDYGVSSAEAGYLWFDSSEEVVKAVLSGLADIGACEESALQRILERDGISAQKDELVRVILTTDPITTDPVVVLPRIAPRVSPLGREMRRAIRDFSLTGGLGDIQYIEATDADYRALLELQDEFERKVGDTEP